MTAWMRTEIGAQITESLNHRITESPNHQIETLAIAHPTPSIASWNSCKWQSWLTDLTQNYNRAKSSPSTLHANPIPRDVNASKKQTSAWNHSHNRHGYSYSQETIDIRITPSPLSDKTNSERTKTNRIHPLVKYVILNSQHLTGIRIRNPTDLKYKPMFQIWHL
jgi:hypothetical protein